MIAILCLFLLCSPVRTAAAEALYPQVAQRPPDLLHDFQKNNISASWAPDHPKEWTDKEALKYEFSDGGPWRYTSGAIYAAALSSDEKFLVTANTSHHVVVIDFTTGVQVSDLAFTSTYTSGDMALRVLKGAGGYDVLISLGFQEVQRLQISPRGEQIGNITVYPGGLLYEKGSPSVSHNERLFITVVPTAGQYDVYDLDNPNRHVILKNQVDDYYDVSFTPDDQYAVARSYSWNGIPASTKMFDITTGALVRDFNNTSSETLSISPDGNLLATTFNRDAVQIWSLRNATAGPTTLKTPVSFRLPVTRLSWSPDGAYLIVSGYGNLFVWEMGPTPTIVQHYQVNGDSTDVVGLLWLRGSTRLAYRVFGGLEVYNFETNLKYRWGFGPNSHWQDGVYLQGSTFLAKSKGWIGGLDGDAKVRFWEAPA